MRRALAALALVVSICGCEFAGARINVYNRSDETLTAIELTGSGFSAAVDSLPPGGTASVRVNPDGESALSVAFTASGERHTIEEQGAFDGRAHYQVRVEVKPDLSVSVREFLK